MFRASRRSRSGMVRGRQVLQQRVRDRYMIRRYSMRRIAALFGVPARLIR